MRILLTNDDGIDSPGLHALREIALQLSEDVWVVAPETNQSGASHSLSLHEPLRMRRVDERAFAVRGTPTDSVIMGVRHVELPIHGVQFHPESILTEGGHRMLANWLGYCGAAPAESLVRRLEDEVANAVQAATTRTPA